MERGVLTVGESVVEAVRDPQRGLVILREADLPAFAAAFSEHRLPPSPPAVPFTPWRQQQRQQLQSLAQLAPLLGSGSPARSPPPSPTWRVASVSK